MAPPSGLAKSILSLRLRGYENIQRDPRKAVLAAMHRPVTIHRFLGHAANTYWEGDSFDSLSF
jgi:hypothetical protein